MGALSRVLRSNVVIRRPLCLAGAILLSGCAAAPAVLSGLGAAASVAGYVDKLYTAGADIVAATAAACTQLSAAQAAERAQVAAGVLAADATATPWYAALCDNLSPSNPNLNASSPAWVATGLTKIRMGR